MAVQIDADKIAQADARADERGKAAAVCAVLQINKIERFDLTLPQNAEFAQRDLCEGLSAKTAAVEGAKK